jgi:hypothetical protein
MQGGEWLRLDTSTGLVRRQRLEGFLLMELMRGRLVVKVDAKIMARRAQSGLQPLHLIGLLVIVAGALFAVFKLLNRSTDPLTGLTALDTRDFLESASALSGNEYRVEGTIDDRLDNWKSADGRLFSVQVSDGSNLVPVWVPSHIQANIQRGQHYVFKVRVLDTGILEVLELLKS